MVQEFRETHLNSHRPHTTPQQRQTKVTAAASPKCSSSRNNNSIKEDHSSCQRGRGGGLGGVLPVRGKDGVRPLPGAEGGISSPAALPRGKGISYQRTHPTPSSPSSHPFRRDLEQQQPHSLFPQLTPPQQQQQPRQLQQHQFNQPVRYGGVNFGSGSSNSGAFLSSGSQSLARMDPLPPTPHQQQQQLLRFNRKPGPAAVTAAATSSSPRVPRHQVDDEGLILPKKLHNPCLESKEVLDLNKEIKWNAKT